MTTPSERGTTSQPCSEATIKPTTALTSIDEDLYTNPGMISILQAFM